MKIPSEAELIETLPQRGPMPLIIEMGNPVEVIMEELTDPVFRCVSQESVAITYAFCWAQLGDRAPWPKINAAIRARWRGKSALERVKKLAYRQLLEWERRGKEAVLNAR